MLQKKIVGKRLKQLKENGKVIIKGKDLIGAWPTVIAYKDKKLKGNCSFKLKMEYAAIAAEGDHLLNSISTLHKILCLVMMHLQMLLNVHQKELFGLIKIKMVNWKMVKKEQKMLR